jgi:hypothetical protein
LARGVELVNKRHALEGVNAGRFRAQHAVVWKQGADPDLGRALFVGFKRARTD